MLSWTADAGLCINPSDELTMLAFAIITVGILWLILDRPSPPEV